MLFYKYVWLEYLNRYLLDQTTQAYGTYPGTYQQTNYFYPSTGQSSQSPLYPSIYTTQTPYNYNINTVPATKQQIHAYSPYYYSTTRNPYDFRDFQNYQYTAETKQTQYTLPSSSQTVSTESTTITPSSTTTTSIFPTAKTTVSKLPFYLKYNFSTTKNPYDFKDFATKRSVSKFTTATSSITTPSYKSFNPFSSSTTIKPTTAKSRFGFFSKLDLQSYFNRTTTKNPYDFDLSNYKDISNNNIKRSYSLNSYYGSPNNPVASFVVANETLAAVESKSHPIFIQKQNNQDHSK